MVIDALDECRFENPCPISANFFISELTNLAMATNGKIVILSHPDPVLRQAMGPALQISLDENLLAEDIQLVFSSEYDRIRLPSYFKSVVAERVASSAHGSFLWTVLLLRHLKMGVREDFLQRVENFPSKLASVYDTMLVDCDAQMSPDDIICRYEIFLLSSGARKPLSAHEITSALRIRHDDHEEIITRLCKPLASVVEGVFQFVHPSVRVYLTDKTRIPTDDNPMPVVVDLGNSDALLAEKCFLRLLADEYGSKDTIGRLLRQYYDDSAVIFTSCIHIQVDGLSYEYASRFWYIHLTAVTSPEPKLLKLAARFLSKFQFVYWSEDSIRSTGDLEPIKSASQQLKGWYSRLPEDAKPDIQHEIDEYFTGPYRRLSQAYESGGQNTVLPCLTLMRLGAYFVAVGNPEAAIPIRERTAKHLLGLLGPRHPLTLRARADMAFSYLSEGRMEEARKIYTDVEEIQREVIGDQAKEYYVTMVYKGETEYYMTDFQVSTETMATASRGFLKVAGPESFEYLAAKMWYAYPLIQIGELQLALDQLEPVFRKRREKYGPGDSVAVMVQVMLGDVKRKLSRPQDSIADLKEALATRQITYPLSHHLSIDVAIELVIALRDFGRNDEAKVELNLIFENGEPKKLFQRYCQVIHLRGLLQFDDNKRDLAITELQSLLIQADRDKYNRAILWAVLDLADMLRRRDKEGDKEQASANFDNILVDLSQSCEQGFCAVDEPDPPRLLQLAEKALQLVRARKFKESTELLTRENISWFRQDDFWLWMGSPAADTGWMKAP